MQKILNKLMFVLLIATMLFPMITVLAEIEPAQTVRRFRFGIPGTPAYCWDQAITPGWSITDIWYAPACTQTLAATNADYDKGLSTGGLASDQWIPVLATDWEIEFWPEEMNSHPVTPFINRGGVKAVNFTLRSGVKFHDGSDWNATVAKWNIDRLFIITGNLTGRGDMRNMYTYWRRVWEWEFFFSPSWNLSNYKNVFGWYDTWYNPNPYVGGVTYAPYSMFPIVNHVEILDNATSGGKIRVVYNDWNGDITQNWGPLRMISMQTYADYWDRGIYGHDPTDPIPHMVGTGPYIYEGHNDAAGGGSMRKNYNYWNRTGLEDAGWYDADYIDIISFPPDELGIESRNTALVTHAIDSTYDNFFSPCNYEDVIAIKNIEYIERPPSEYITAITLNCINETWWGWWPWPAADVPSWFPTSYPAGNVPSGVPLALRKAMSYAFDYDAYINGMFKGRAVRPTVIGVNSIYHNESIGIATHNLVTARATLLADPYFGPRCTARGLYANSTDAEWQNKAATDPIWRYDFYWDQKNEYLKSVLEDSIADIGVALTNPNNEDGYHKLTTNMWDKVGSYWVSGFPVFSAQGWPLDWNYPEVYPEGYLYSNYGDINQGRWRLPYAWWADPAFWYYPWFNLAFTYDANVDYWLSRMFMSNTTARWEFINKIVDFEQNQKYPYIYISQSLEGIPVWKDWVADMYYGDISWPLLRYVGLPSEYPEIPGFTTAFIIGSMLLTMLGIMFVVQKKRKL